MSRHKKSVEQVENKVEEAVEHVEQAVDSAESFAKKEIEEDIVSETIEKETQAEEQIKEVSEENAPEKVIVQQKSGGKGLALLALLVALAVGGAGHFMANKKFAEIDTQIQAVSAKASQQQPVQTAVEIPNFDAEKAQINELSANYQKALELSLIHI